MLSPSWYVIQTKPKAEQRVCQGLLSKHIKVFLPKIETKRKRRYVIVPVIEPVFPGYVFVRIQPHPNNWYKLKWTPGVKTILGLDGIPTPVPDEVIAQLQERVRQKGFIKPRVKFHRGEKVQITDGPLKGLFGVIEEARPGKDRINLLMSIMYGTAKVQASASELQKVS